MPEQYRERLHCLWRAPHTHFYNITVVFVTVGSPYVCERRSGTAGHSNTPQQPSASYLSKCQMGLSLCPSPLCSPSVTRPTCQVVSLNPLWVTHSASFYRAPLTFAVISQHFFFFFVIILILFLVPPHLVHHLFRLFVSLLCVTSKTDGCRAGSCSWCILSLQGATFGLVVIPWWNIMQCCPCM